jgi:hypothetical protein
MLLLILKILSIFAVKNKTRLAKIYFPLIGCMLGLEALAHASHWLEDLLVVLQLQGKLPVLHRPRFARQ